MSLVFPFVFGISVCDCSLFDPCVVPLRFGVPRVKCNLSTISVIIPSKYAMMPSPKVYNSLLMPFQNVMPVALLVFFKDLLDSTVSLVAAKCKSNQC